MTTDLLGANQPTPIPAISLWQPWASFIAIGVKPYETRHWVAPRQYIGKRIAIHAAKHKPDHDEYEWWQEVSKRNDPLPLGAFVCTALLRAVLRTEDVLKDDYGDYKVGRFAWYLTDIEALDPPVPARGYQGFWMWDRGVAPDPDAALRRGNDDETQNQIQYIIRTHHP